MNEDEVDDDDGDGFDDAMFAGASSSKPGVLDDALNSQRRTLGILDKDEKKVPCMIHLQFELTE